MADPVSISAIIVAVIGAIGAFVSQAHLRKCTMFGCIKSDCREDSGAVPDTPDVIQSPKLPRKGADTNEHAEKVSSV